MNQAEEDIDLDLYQKELSQLKQVLRNQSKKLLQQKYQSFFFEIENKTTQQNNDDNLEYTEKKPFRILKNGSSGNVSPMAQYSPRNQNQDKQLNKSIMEYQQYLQEQLASYHSETNNKELDKQQSIIKQNEEIKKPQIKTSEKHHKSKSLKKSRKKQYIGIYINQPTQQNHTYEKKHKKCRKKINFKNEQNNRFLSKQILALQLQQLNDFTQEQIIEINRCIEDTIKNYQQKFEDLKRLKYEIKYNDLKKKMIMRKNQLQQQSQTLKNLRRMNNKFQMQHEERLLRQTEIYHEKIQKLNRELKFKRKQLILNQQTLNKQPIINENYRVQIQKLKSKMVLLLKEIEQNKKIIENKQSRFDKLQQKIQRKEKEQNKFNEKILEKISKQQLYKKYIRLKLKQKKKCEEIQNFNKQIKIKIQKIQSQIQKQIEIRNKVQQKIKELNLQIQFDKKEEINLAPQSKITIQKQKLQTSNQGHIGYKIKQKLNKPTSNQQDEKSQNTIKHQQSKRDIKQTSEKYSKKPFTFNKNKKLLISHTEGNQILPPIISTPNEKSLRTKQNSSFKQYNSKKTIKTLKEDNELTNDNITQQNENIKIEYDYQNRSNKLMNRNPKRIFTSKFSQLQPKKLLIDDQTTKRKLYEQQNLVKEFNIHSLLNIEQKKNNQDQSFFRKRKQKINFQ